MKGKTQSIPGPEGPPHTVLVQSEAEFTSKMNIDAKQINQFIMMNDDGCSILLCLRKPNLVNQFLLFLCVFQLLFSSVEIGSSTIPVLV